MVLEVAILNIKPGESDEFEVAFAEAQQIIAAMPGYQSHELRKCLEIADRYLLLVHWDSVEAHEVGFRGSEDYQRWKALLHHFYDPLPEVHHYLTLGQGKA